jgi:DNA-binding MarR family transcriptional regulator
MSKRTLSPCDIAHALYERGANVIPLAPASKEPAGRWAHWATHPQDWPDVERLFVNAGPEANIAALGGIHSAAVADDWGYLALLDCDSGEALDMGRALVKATLGADPLISLSARGGHIWLRTPQPVKSARWPGGELRGYRSYVVAPGSIHPSGARYKWANDGAEILRCDGLPGIPWQYIQRDRLPRLAAAIMRADERVLSRYATRSEVDWALILSLVNAGASFERVHALYLASRHPKHLDPSRRDFERRLMAEYLRAKEQGNSADYTKARELAERVKAWALSAAFPGTSPRTRETDRRVLIAHCDRAIKAGKSEWHLSQRDIEQAAQVRAPTARIATRRLIKAGLLTRRQGFVGQYAQTYGWGKAVSSFAHLHTLGGSVCKWANGETPDYAAHPAFEHRGLGRHAGRIFETLARQGEATAKQLVALSGCTRATTYRYLKLMLKLQLVGYDPSRRIYWACPEMLDGIARYLETHHIPARRRARIERERAAFRRRLKRAARAGSTIAT